MDVAELIATYGESWNEPDEAARRKLLEAAWCDDGTYTDPTAHVSGRDELLTHIAGMRQAFPDARIEPTSGVEEHHGWFRFAWKMLDATGATAMEGFDVGSLGDDGRIGRIVGFFGPFPEASASS
jgi:hypothetical protein